MIKEGLSPREALKEYLDLITSKGSRKRLLRMY